MKNMLSFLSPGSCILFKTELEYWLTVSVLFSVALAIAGSILSGTLILGFLIWNLFLAYIPYGISKWMYRNIDSRETRMKFCLFCLVWLLFIPNSFYILTDLFHLGGFHGLPLWYELAMILSLAWNGLLFGILSVRQMQKLVDDFLSKRTALLFIYPVMFLNALGVYIGRYLRFNSWDVITNPFHLLKEISNLAFHPIQYKYAWSMVLCFSFVLTLMYLTIIKTNEQARH